MSEDKQPWFKQSQCETCTETQKRIQELTSELKLTIRERNKAADTIDLKNGSLAEIKSLCREMSKALEYCAVDPGLLQPENNRQCAVAMNALAKYNAIFSGEDTALLGGEGK